MKKFLIISTIMMLMKINLFAFNSDEKLYFDIKYGFVSAGTASLEVNKITYNDSISALTFTSRAKTNSVFDKIFKVRDFIESVWDEKNKVSLRFTKKLREGFYQQHRIHIYYPDQNKTYYIKYNLKKNTKKEKMLPIMPNTQDILSAFYSIRLQDLKVGEYKDINVTADGLTFTTKVAILRREKIDTIFGKKQCLVIEPLLKNQEAIFKQTGKVLIWITDDEEKVPVKLQSKIVFGSFYAVLTDAKNTNLKKKD